MLKGDSFAHLLGSVRETLAGESPMDPRLAGTLLRREDPEGPPLPSPSPPEPEALGHLVAGKPNHLIAQEIHASLSTVKRHLERMTSTLGVSYRTQAAVGAIELGLLPERR